MSEETDVPQKPKGQPKKAPMTQAKIDRLFEPVPDDAVPGPDRIPLKSLRLEVGASVPGGVSRTGSTIETYFTTDAKYSLELVPAWDLIHITRSGAERWIPVGRMLECEPLP